jgi:outer membrane protein TolC
MNRTYLVACLAGASLIAANAAAIDWNDPPAVARAAADVSPSLAALKYQIVAARERITSAGSLPNPMVMGGVQNQQADLSTDRMMTMYWAGASQTLTRRSKRIAQRTEAELEVRRLEREYESLRAEVERDTLLAYYDAAAAQSQNLATSEVIALAKQTTSAA